MTARNSTVTVPLVWPIDVEGGAQVTRLVFKRPKGRVIKKLLVLIGDEAIAAILAEEGGQKDKLSERMTARFMSELASFARPEKLEALTEIIADLAGVAPAVIDEVDPEDYPAVFGVLSGFFPDLFSDGEPTPQT